jgi:hypothetical protein
MTILLIHVLDKNVIEYFAFNFSGLWFFWLFF